jgi:hypothetical protein
MRNAWFILGMAMAAALGCVDRRYVIYVDQPNGLPDLGAVVERNGQVLGATPVDDHFVYYGKYNFKLVKPGYETLQVVQNIPAPWYQYPGLDFFAENVWPFRIIDRREFHYQMVPVMQPQINDLLRQADNQRLRGWSIQPPPGTQPPVPAGPPAGIVQPAPTLQPPPGSQPPRAPLPPAAAAVPPPPPTLQPPPGTGRP